MTPADGSSATALQEALERIAALEQENNLLRQKIDLLVRRIFGAKSEKLDAAQLELLLTGTEGDPAPGKVMASRVPAAGDTPEALPAEHAPRRSQERRPRLPEHLPVEEEILIPDIVLAEPAQWRCIGEEPRLTFGHGTVWITPAVARTQNFRRLKFGRGWNHSNPITVNTKAVNS